ncbi:MAG TPA: hypothetical protein DCM45_05645 [Clostridiales bacterium]|nr:hypothetical protein [Clostridiales bacterium]
MALQKTITDDRGITATYFRVAAIIEQYSTDIPVITVQLLGYADSTYRDREKLGGVQSLANSFKEVYLSASDEQGYARADIYKRLAAEIPEFIGSKEI